MSGLEAGASGRLDETALEFLPAQVARSAAARPGRRGGRRRLSAVRPAARQWPLRVRAVVRPGAVVRGGIVFLGAAGRGIVRGGIVFLGAARRGIVRGSAALGGAVRGDAAGGGVARLAVACGAVARRKNGRRQYAGYRPADRCGEVGGSGERIVRTYAASSWPLPFTAAGGVPRPELRRRREQQGPAGANRDDGEPDEA